MFKIVSNKKSKGLCTAYRCKNKHTPKDRFCAKHRHRYNKFINPIKYTYHQKRSRARERGIEWNLTIEEFRDFVIETNYMQNKGKKAGSASIDRIDPRKGYEVGNLQILSLSDNSKKMHTDKNDCPF